ncbi:hypothetical protein KAFR_0C05130 [Kazachstania africana CBS 2517]|uniref:Protein kinase domain-containing protein n=1 Tax=Kazachstania africana (strain ATCC 22294 / BCRC 22015 / CBS 2517 / CECT 1963 / NBRC 1671 / NRRL Y-8276) TaxID=1071382 RepID=H2AT04_KAZAF|nr:hypothetical protein KAFR_0C05130 [Kazachstania africana CBS 2517]CCF57504.1 hypothetical protein KAFR_0C05130 [Kazachstania africana CBS 2517]
MSGAVLGYLEVVSAEDSGPVDNRVSINRHEILRIGRNKKECHLLLNDPSISSVHCILWAILFDDDSVPMCYIKDLSLNGTTINGKSLNKNTTYLLEDGDEINLWLTKAKRDKSTVYPLFRFKAIGSDKQKLHLMTQLQLEKDIDCWNISPKVIGNGTFGHVMVCFNMADTQNTRLHQINKKLKNYAVKIIKLKPNKLDKEAKILIQLNHPNIIKVYHTYVDPLNNLYIFQDLVPGGDLFSYLAKGDRLTSISESESLLIVYQILKALEYLHRRGIVHRDLKLDNILLESPEPCTRIILADFGIAKHLTSNVTRMHTVVGTPEYCAPEVGFKANRKIYKSFSRAATIDQQKTGYDHKCDIWSLGVITHIMLTGISPFYGDGTEKSIIQNAKSGTLDFEVKHWQQISRAAKTFVKSVLQVDVTKRLDIDESLKHSWISNHRVQLEEIYRKKILRVTP